MDHVGAGQAPKTDLTATFSGAGAGLTVKLTQIQRTASA